MSLPTYQHINLRSIDLTELQNVLVKDLNLKNPVVFNLKSLTPDEQRELIGLIENFFDTNGISYKFPYPVYLQTDFESSITRMPTVNESESLPKFFALKESKINVKDSQLIGKNRLLQQEIHNSDGAVVEIETYGKIHRQIFESESELLSYRSILERLAKGKDYG